MNITIVLFFLINIKNIVPPSKDRFKPKKSLREKSNRKHGGQIGYQGRTLLMVKNPPIFPPNVNNNTQYGKNIEPRVL